MARLPYIGFLDTDRQYLEQERLVLGEIESLASIAQTALTTSLEAMTVIQKLRRQNTSTLIWTPSITFATPGDVSVTYSSLQGTSIIFHDLNIAVVNFKMVTSAFTHTTASGAFRITGFPVAVSALFRPGYGMLRFWQGFTFNDANHTQINPYLLAGSGNKIIEFGISGSGTTLDVLDAVDVPTGGTIQIEGEVTYITEDFQLD